MHIRRVITLICILVCVLKADPKRGLYGIYTNNAKNKLITHGSWEIKKKLICHIKYKGHPRTY